jgi:hypothetical protein
MDRFLIRRLLPHNPSELPSERLTANQLIQINPIMIRTILSIAVLTSFSFAAVLKADPSPTSDASSSKKKQEKSKTAPKIVPAAPLKQGWSLVNGVWTHSDGYQLVKGQVVRVGTQTHKTPPKPPTKAEMDAATKKPSSKNDPAAAKAAERERNLTPSRPASQTGSHL